MKPIAWRSRAAILLSCSCLLAACGEASPEGQIAESQDGAVAEASGDSGIVPDNDAAQVPPEAAADSVAAQDASIPGSPTVEWQIPLQGETVTGTLTETNCTVAVTSDEPIARVEFMLDGVLLNTEKAAPFGCLWDTTTAKAGSHELSAIAFDTAGGSGSASILVNVKEEIPPIGTIWYVDSSTGNDSNDGLSPTTAWQTAAKVNSETFQPGDVVRIHGTVTDQLLGDPGSGTSQAPIVIEGNGPFDGRAKIRGIRLAKAEHVTFRNLEASGKDVDLVTTPYSADGVIRFVRFENLYLHDANGGIVISGPKHTDLSFVDTTIRGMWLDGVLLNDKAGDRFSFTGGSIRDTGNRGYLKGWGVHGVYASGGHGHLFDGVEFGENANGWSISMRRGNMTIRGCRFNGGQMINNNNEDEGSTNPYTGSPSKNLTYWIYRNVFLGPGAIFQGGNNDVGINNPGNTWAVFNNTFVDTTVNFGSADGTAEFYNIYLRNNVFVGGAVQMKAPVSGRVHELSHNGWWNAGTPKGTANITTDPLLDASHAVTAAAYRNAGTDAIASGISLVPNASDPLGYSGTAPDVGRDEY